MLIGVTGDTHRCTWCINDAVKKLSDCDIIIHLGDNVEDVNEISKYYKGTIINVRGNCDYSQSVPCDKIEVIDGKKFFITHGHRYDIKYDLSRLKSNAIKYKADIVLYGHTHVSCINFENGIWFLNPGSPALPRDGFKSVGVIEINNGKIIPNIRCI